tara:strand:- start:388 stop:1080 length:693 start_codon:yes stop_codon:yes gene_type:complete
MGVRTGIQQSTWNSHPGLRQALIEHGVDPDSKEILKKGSKEFKTYQALKSRAKGIEYRCYRKWREHARADGLEVEVPNASGGGWANLKKEKQFIRFKQQCFSDLEKDKDGNYMCPVCSGENAHPLVVESYRETLKNRNDKGHTISRYNKKLTGRQISAESYKKEKKHNNIHDWTPSVDKIHDHLPHTIDNIQVICWRMNKHKGNLTLSELQDLGQWAENREVDETAGYYD